MTQAELLAANAHLMARIKPFLTNPLVSTPLTVFFYDEKTSVSRTVTTNEAGHFTMRAALEFIPTHVRVLASENLSVTEEIKITEPKGVSLISDVMIRLSIPLLVLVLEKFSEMHSFVISGILRLMGLKNGTIQCMTWAWASTMSPIHHGKCFLSW